MHLLFVNKELPYPPVGGGKMRVYSLLKHLAERHQVSLIAFGHVGTSADSVAALQEFCDEVVVVPFDPQQLRANKRKEQLRSMLRSAPYQKTAYYTPAMQRAIDTFVASHQVDVLTIEYAQMGYYQLPGTVPCVLDQHNVENEIFYRTYRTDPLSLRKLYSLLEWRKFQRDELAICRKFPLIVTTSERDRQVLATHIPTSSFVVIPNGVDSAYFRPSATQHTDDVILFTGTIDYYPNTDGLLFFLQDVLPLIRQQRPNVKFVIAGKNPPDQIKRYTTDPNIVVTGYVDDIRDYYNQATVFVTPLRVGGGTRLKILEAMSMQKAIVSTTIGAEGIDVTHGENLLLADDAAAFADAVVTLLHNQEQRDHLSLAGRRLVEQQYDWTLVVRRLEQAYEQLHATSANAGSLFGSIRIADPHEQIAG